MPMIVLETAQAVKFAETIREALGRDPVRPAGFDGIENLPQGSRWSTRQWIRSRKSSSATAEKTARVAGGRF
jgi:threonine synthase